MSRSQSHTNATVYPLTGSIRESAHRIWLAGLGAYSRAENEGVRVFDQLVTVGTAFEKKARQQVSRPVKAAERGWSEARTSAGDAWNHLEIAFERRVARALNSLQIPTHRDVAELSRRVEDLQRAVDRLSRKAPVRRRAAARKKTVSKKVAARPAKQRKTASRSSAR